MFHFEGVKVWKKWANLASQVEVGVVAARRVEAAVGEVLEEVLVSNHLTTH